MHEEDFHLPHGGGRRREEAGGDEARPGTEIRGERNKEAMSMLDAVEHGTYRARRTTRGNPSELWAKGRPGGSRSQKLGRARGHGERSSQVSGRSPRRPGANDSPEQRGENPATYGASAGPPSRWAVGRREGTRHSAG